MRQTICVNEINEAMNCRMSVKSNIVPGIAGTMYVGSDRYAVVVTEVISQKKIKVAHVLDAHIELFQNNQNGVQFLHEEYLEAYRTMNSNSFYAPRVYTLRKNGRWMPQGANMWETCSVHLGKAENYRDPNY